MLEFQTSSPSGAGRQSGQGSMAVPSGVLKHPKNAFLFVAQAKAHTRVAEFLYYRFVQSWGLGGVPQCQLSSQPDKPQFYTVQVYITYF